MPSDPPPEGKKVPFVPRAGGLVFVVSREALDRYEDLKRVFADDKRVTIMLDRRSGERRQTMSVRGAERRRTDRRSRTAIEDGLRRQGWALVRPDVPAAPQNWISGEPVKSILVVDDDPMVASLLEDILRSDGHRVRTARNGVEALALLAAPAFDLLLVDILMPELDGPALYRELERGNPEQARRVMFMTGGAVEAETAEMLSTIGLPLLRKPFEIKEFRAMVRQFFLAADTLCRRG